MVDIIEWKKGEVLVEGVVGKDRVVHIDDIGNAVENRSDMEKKPHAEMKKDELIGMVRECCKKNDLNTIFDLIKVAGKLEDEVNIEIAKVLKEKAWTSLAENFIGTVGVCEKAKKIAKGGIWEIERGVQLPPMRFGNTPGKKRSGRSKKVIYNCPVVIGDNVLQSRK